MKIFLCSMGVLLLSESVLAAPCKISESVYREADGQGFELVFGAAPTGSPLLATVTLQHPKQVPLYRFDLTQANGYGSISLMWRQQPKSERHSFRLNFFSQAFQSATPGVFGREPQAPKYAFITDLASFDYYRRRGAISNSTAPYLKDVLWVHDRCLNNN